MFSCSKNDELIENNINSKYNESSTSRNGNVNNIKDLAEEIYFDVDYKNYAEINFEITKKLNIEDNYQEIENLNTEQDLKVWVSNNINKTQFESIEDFYEIIQQSEVLKSIFLNKFENKFENFRNFNNFIQIFECQIYEIANSENSKVDAGSGGGDCYTKAKNCITRAQNNATAGFGASIVGAYFNPIVGAVGGITTYIYLQNALAACQDALDTCLGN